MYDTITIPVGQTHSTGRLVMPIIRYANRKMYSMVAHRYVTLSEVVTMLSSGVELQVRRHEDGEDVTADVIGQAVVKGLKDGAVAPSRVAEVFRG